MKKFFYILSFVVVNITTLYLQANGQIADSNLPMVCSQSYSEYKVGSLFHGFSDFKWRIYQTLSPFQDTLFITHYDLYARGDSIRVYWDVADDKGGIFTLEVQETNDFGCSGNIYKTDVMVNTNTFFIPADQDREIYKACFGNSITLDAGYFGDDARYLWTNFVDSTKRTFITTEAGTYQVRIFNSITQGCTFDTLQAVINPLPYVWLGNDTTLFANQTLTLDVNDPTFATYSWYNKFPVSGSPISTASSLTVDGLSGSKTYTVVVTDLNGCENSDNIKVGAADYSKLQIPATFTPNGDQINDKWYFPRPDKLGEDLQLYAYFDDVEVKVFNRWGKLVWESSKSFKPWDGKDLNGRDLPMDSYHYIIVFKVSGKEYNYKGSVTIIR